jgi:hypothetical protein
MSEYITDLYYRIIENEERLKTFQVDANFIINTYQQAGYPDIEKLKAALQSADPSAVSEQLGEISQWNVNLNKNNYENYDQRYEAYKMLRDYDDTLTPSSTSIEEAQKIIADVQSKTRQNMQWIANQIQSAISRVSNWNNSPIIITPSPVSGSFGNEWLEPATGAGVRVGGGNDDELSPDFEIFVHENQIIIPPEGINEDNDFFQNPRVTSDYFNLIKELQNPGSTNRPGKILTLFTARPVEHREQYMSATTVPGGIWLSSSSSNVEDVALDLSGKRDIWKVRIDERYVQKHLDMGSYQHYEVMGREPVPVKSIKLYYPAD